MGIWDWLRRGAGAAPATTTPPAPPAAAPPPTVMPVTPPSGTGSATLKPKTPWERIEIALIWTIPAILLITLALNFALVAQLLRGVERADEKTLIVGASALFACVTLVFLTRLIRSLEAGEQLGLESHWGGLGGGVGGWRISMPVTYFIGVVTFAALTAVAVSNYSKTNAKAETPATTQTAEKTTTASTTATTGSTVSSTGTTTTGTTGTQGTAAATTTAKPH